MLPEALHQPVLLKEAVDALNVQPNHWYIDATFGRGGHTRQILNLGGKVLAFDVDQEAIEFAQIAFAPEIAEQRFHIVRENFENIAKAVTEFTLGTEIKGILFDFGTSVDQLTSSERGFSFTGQGELDMRLDQRLGVKAKDLLALLSEKQLADIFWQFGGERESRKLAKEIVSQRAQGHFIQTVEDFTELVLKVKREPRRHLHPATKAFQALRIAVNRELDVIQQALPQALKVIKAGRIVTIAFHEGEDRIIKQYFQEWEKAHHGQNLFKHPLTATEEEIQSNSRSRSAKLRAFEVCQN